MFLLYFSATMAATDNTLYYYQTETIMISEWHVLNSDFAKAY